MRPGRLVTRGLTAAVIAASGMTFMSGGCSPESLRALLIGLDAAAGQIEQQNRDVTFGDWLESEFDDVFEDN